MPKGKEMAPWVVNQPVPTIFEAQRGWVLYRGVYHAIETMPSGLFRAIVIDSYPTARSSLMLKQVCPLDTLERWHILQWYPLKLYFLRKGEFHDR
jgi:hypothetical protein